MTASFADQEIWHVMVARDDLKRMNVDQLDDAFRLDIVDASTLVWKQGMETWRRLGSIAGIDDEPETIARAPARPLAPPPPPRPQPRSLAPAVNPFGATVNPFGATVNPFGATVNPFAATAQHASNAAAVFPSPLVAPVASPQLFAPDPYTLPKRRVKVPSEVDFRRSSHGVRWGRWLLAFALLTTGVLVAYRQNYLREGARRIGLENKYLYGEKRAVAWVTAKSPGAIQAALRQLKLLPAGAAAAAALTPSVAVAAPATPPPPAAPEINAAAPTTPRSSDPGVKTVSLDSLPVLGSEPAAAPAAAPAAPAPAAKARAVTRSQPAPKVSAKPRKQAAVEAEDEPAPKPKAKPKAETATAPKPAKAPPPTMSSPLKAAIWQAMQEEAKKGK